MLKHIFYLYMAALDYNTSVLSSQSYRAIISMYNTTFIALITALCMRDTVFGYQHGSVPSFVHTHSFTRPLTPKVTIS